MSHERAFRFGASADRAASAAAWRELSRRVEDLGFATLTVPDHLGDQFAPIPALAAAATATTTLHVGTLVACNDYRHPVVHAKEIATLDVLSGGRVEWGMGAGWLAPEYESSGIAFDPGPVRLARLREAVTVMKSLFAGGPVDHHGTYYDITGLDGFPKPAQATRMPLLVGGSQRAMLGFAAREADIVSILPSLKGRILAAGQSRETEDVALDRQIGWVQDAGSHRLEELELNMVAFPAIVTEDRKGRAIAVGRNIGLTAEETLVSPHLWIGTVDQICGQIEAARDRWGVSYWVVPASAADAVAPVAGR